MSDDILEQAKQTLEAAGYTVHKKREGTRRKRREIPTLTPAEVDAMLAEMNPTRPDGQRTRALFVFLLATGLRIGEAINLTPADLEMCGDYAVVSVPDEKGCKTGARRVPFAWTENGNPTRTAVELSAWIVQRPASEYLFCSIKGAKYSRNSFNRSLATFAEKAGIEKRVHAHVLRHTFATNAVSDGWSQADVQRALGHASPNTTSIYINSDITRLIELVRR